MSWVQKHGLSLVAGVREGLPGGMSMRHGHKECMNPSVNAFCRSFLHAIKRRNNLMAILSCRAFLLALRTLRDN